MSDINDDEEPPAASDPDVQAEDQPVEHKDPELSPEELVPPGESVDAQQHPDVS